MANIITPALFVNDLAVPNAVAQPSIGDNYPDGTEKLADCITYTERQVLLNAMGLTEYRLLQDALPVTGASLQKWKDLVNGVDYTTGTGDGIVNKTWEGLGSEKSLLAYAAYYNFLCQESQYWATTGIVIADSANSKFVSPAYKLATAWQTFMAKYRKGCYDYPYVEYGTGYELIDWNGGNHDGPEVSLYEFLRDNADTYSWKPEYFKGYETVNSFGL